MDLRPIGLFDSGVGGLSVLNKCLEILPNEHYIYLADSSHAPYGNKSFEYILQRVHECSETLISMGAKAVVVACNTATNVGIAQLRKDYNCIFVGLEPALKPAMNERTCGKVLVLMTEATYNQQKFKELYNKFDDGNIIISPQRDLAMMIEDSIDDVEILRKSVYKILLNYKGVESVVLGCTHYIFIKQLIEDFYENKIKIYDGNEGAAKRLYSLLKGDDLLSDNKGQGTVKIITL